MSGEGTRSIGRARVVKNNYRSLNSLMRHMRESAGINVGGSPCKRALAQVGYFHGYKGYRYSGESTRLIPYSEFNELLAVIDFDTRLKGIFYPVLMKTEMMMKNLALVEILEAAGSSSLTDIYRTLMPGNRRGLRKGKLEVIHSNAAVLLSSYKRNNVIVRHYYDSPAESVPVWGLMEVITLGHFARLLEQLSDSVLTDIAARWGMQRRDGQLVPHLVFAVTDLRNCVAHNGIVFDTRFATGEIRRQVKSLLRREVGFKPEIAVKFETITDYFVLVIYLACSMGFPKREIKALIREYTLCTDELRSKVPVKMFDMIVHTDNRVKLNQLQQWVTSR